MSANTVDQGHALLRSRNPAAALVSFRAATETEPSDAQAWRGMVKASIELRIWREASSCLERLVALTAERPELSALLLLRGQILDLHLNDTATARPMFEKALMHQPERVWLYLALAEVDLRLRRWSRSIAHSDHGLELCGPDAAERPWLYLTKAVASQRVSVSMGPQSTFFRTLRGQAADHTVDPGERAYRQAASQLPELAGIGYRTWLEDEAGAIAFVRDRMPRPAIQVS